MFGALEWVKRLRIDRRWNGLRVDEVEEKQECPLQYDTPTMPLPENTGMERNQRKATDDVDNIQSEIQQQYTLQFADFMCYLIRGVLN